MNGETMNEPIHAAAAPATCRQRLRARRGQSGFSLIELIVVVTIIGILAAVAVINIQNAQRKAREAALKDNLYKMRQAIDNFYADKQHFPADLNELVPNYLKKIPKDPVTNAEDWEPVMAQPDENEPSPTDTAGGGAAGPGVIDVKSGASGSTLDGTPYSEL